MNIVIAGCDTQQWELRCKYKNNPPSTVYLFKQKLICHVDLWSQIEGIAMCTDDSLQHAIYSDKDLKSI